MNEYQKTVFAPGTPASADPERAKILDQAMYSMRRDSTPASDLDDNCKPGSEVDVGNEYKRDRSGSKKRESKTHNRARAKAAKKARKAQR